MAAEQKIDDSCKVIRIKAAPKGKPTPSDTFEACSAGKVDLNLPENSVLIESEYVSVDPYQRARIGAWSQSDSKQMQSFTLAKVLKSNNAKYAEGDHVWGVFGWTSKQVVNAKQIMSKVPPDLSQYKPKEDPDYKADQDDDKEGKFDVKEIAQKIPLSYYVGSYGMPGGTAYYGLIYKGEVKKGENVLVSGAAGAVGSIVGQIAKNVYGCHTVGIAGTAEKIKWITQDLGFDGGINYKEYGDDYEKVQKALKEKFPNGIDVFFDNVGGIFSEAAWDLLNEDARVIVCGQIATYNADPKNPGLIRPFLHKTIYKEIQIRGIIYGKFKNHAKFYYDMGRWICSGKVKVKETVLEGFEKLPEAFCGLFEGQNTGKMVVKCT